MIECAYPWEFVFNYFKSEFVNFYKSKIIVIYNFQNIKRFLMKILIQRVLEGSVTVDNIEISKIG